MAQITQIITIHEYNQMTDEQKAALSENNMLAVLQQDWQQVHIDAAIKLTCALSEKLLGAGYNEKQIVKQAVDLTDALVAELKKGEDNADIQQ
jgi:hypothetical protein